MIRPFFSIIIPTYNRQHCLKVAVESVISQTFKHWELLVIDDGSTDDTKSLISHYTDDRVKYYYKEHAERSAARNFGIILAKGQFICFLDSDDEYLDCLLQSHYDAIEENPDYSIFRAGTIMRKDGVMKHITDFNKHLLTFEDLFINMNGPSSYCIKRSLLKENKFDERFYIAEDFHLLTRLIKNNDFICVKKYAFIFNFRSESVLKKNLNIPDLINKIECYIDLLHLSFSSNQKKLIFKKFLNVLLVGLYIYFKTFDYQLYKKLYKAFKFTFCNVEILRLFFIRNNSKYS
jgi:glycosyltransferase involved in cell wall biosynthesis